MSTECIYNVDLTTNNNDIISVSSDNFNHFYIANIDDNGNEINYDKIKNTDSLFANFFMIKILKDESTDSIINIERLLKKRDIVKIGINFTNGKYQIFELAKKRVANKGSLVNEYEDAFMDNNGLCILISDKNIKYKNNLFI